MTYRWVLKCGDPALHCAYVSAIDPGNGLFVEYSSQRMAKMFMTKKGAVDALRRRNTHPHWYRQRPPNQVRVVRLKLKEKM